MKFFESLKLNKKYVSILILGFMLFLPNMVYSNENTTTNEKSMSFVDNKDRRNYIKNGKKAIYWHNINNKWYFFGEDGDMVVGWQYILPKIFNGLFEGDPVIEIGAFPKWYYFNEDGTLVEEGWKKLPIKHSLNTNRKYGESIEDIGVEYKWFYFDKEGSALSGWFKNNNSWFYLNTIEKHYGEMETGWVGSYFLKNSGYMAKSEWVFDEKYSSWFYLKEDGRYAQNEWIEGYYLKSGGYLK